MELGREIRKLFVPREGCVLVDADYSQIELRVLAHMSNDKNLIQAYRQAEDIHAITASQVFHVPFDEVTPLQRSNAKAVISALSTARARLAWAGFRHQPQGGGGVHQRLLREISQNQDLYGGYD